MSTNNIQYHDKIRKFFYILVFFSYRKNLIGTQKHVQIIPGEEAIGVRVIEILQ